MAPKLEEQSLMTVDLKVNFKMVATKYNILLQVLQPDDRLELEYADGRRLHFAVLRQEVHDAAETELALTGDFAETLVLVTCYPFDAIAAGGSLRYVVVARALSQPLPEIRPKQYLL